MKKWKHILCAIDGSEQSLFGAEQARSLAKNLEAEILYLFVVPSQLTALAGLPLNPEVKRALFDHAEETLELLQKLSDRDSVKSRGHIVEGDPSESILDSAANWKADAIVISARGAGAVTRWLLGSNTTRILQHASVPVMVVRGDPPFKGYHRIVCCLDGSAESEHAAHSALDLAAIYGAEVQMLHVAPSAEESPSHMRGSQAFSAEKAEEWVRAEMERLCSGAGGKVTACTHVFVTGNIADTIVSHADAWGADLITMGSRGLGTFSKVTLGSQSTRVTEHSACPVLLVRRPRS